MSVQAGHVYAGLPIIETRLPFFVNAQFDPLTSRGDLADTEWNRALVPLLADIWAHAAIDLFRRSPEAAWQAMPIIPLSNDEAVSSLIDRLNRTILQSARTSVVEGISIEVAGQGWLRLKELAVEGKSLEGVVTAEETATLLGMQGVPSLRCTRYGREMAEGAG